MEQIDIQNRCTTLRDKSQQMTSTILAREGLALSMESTITTSSVSHRTNEKCTYLLSADQQL